MGKSESDKIRQRRYRNNLKGASEFARDKTSGNSVLDPISYKKDVPVQAWVDSRDIATLSEWLDMKGRTKYLSEVVQEGLRILVNHLVETRVINKVESTAKARELIEWKYRINLGRSKRGRRNALHNQVLTDRLSRGEIESKCKDEDLELVGEIGGEVSEKDKHLLSREKQEELLDIYKKLEQEEMEEAKQRDLEKIKEMNLPREGELVSEEKVLKEGEVSDEEREREDKAYIEQLKNAKPLESQMVKPEE